MQNYTPGELGRPFWEAAQIMLKTTGAVEPAVLFFSNKDDKLGMSIFPVAEFLHSPEGKERLSDVLNSITKDNDDIFAAVFVTEVWAVIADKNNMEDAREHAANESLEHYPGRVERLMMTVRFRDGQSFMKHANIERDSEGNVDKLGPPEVWTDPTGLSGRLFDIFPALQ